MIQDHSDFVYLGAYYLLKKYKNDLQNFDLIGLFILSQYFQNPSLEYSTLYILNHHVTPEDYKSLKQVLTLYPNLHLSKITNALQNY